MPAHSLTLNTNTHTESRPVATGGASGANAPPRREPSPLLHFEMAILTTCGACQGAKILFLRPRICTCMPPQWPHRIACIINFYCKISLPRCLKSQTNLTEVVLPHKPYRLELLCACAVPKGPFALTLHPPFEDLATGLHMHTHVHTHTPLLVEERRNW